MTGSIKTKTPKFKFIIPQFNIATWHDYIEDNFRAIDALFYNIFDIQKFKEMLQFIDSPTEMKKLIDGEDSLQFHIGKDEEGNGLDDVSFVTKKIDIGGGKGGTITLVGPTRMDYDKISNALEYLAEQLMELYGDDDHRKDPS